MIELKTTMPEADFFHYIAKEVRSLVQGFKGQAPIAKHKDVLGDYATEVDIAVEKLIVAEINKRFPGDAILAEEAYADTVISDGRIWIIDPICGTSNLGRGMTSFCTNIALASNKELVAACVVDHSQVDYFWSIGNQEVYCNDQLIHRQAHDENLGTVIDIDFGALGSVSDPFNKNLATAAYKLSLLPGYMLQSLSTSLGFAYTAASKIDGFINSHNHPWDIAASSFLLQQSGGVITDLAGQPWSLSSIGAIGAGSTAVHKQLLAAYNE